MSYRASRSATAASVASNWGSRFSGYHGTCVDDADDCWMTEVRGIEHPPSSLKRGIIPASRGGPRPSSRSAPSRDHRGSRESTTVPHRDLALVQRVVFVVYRCSAQWL